MIKNIEITKLKSHPQNPRKTIGDISELAASIKKNGVFQNLTVVPNEDDTYTIIIGHRRHAAAQEAGLTELPCAVVEMTEKEQLSTMLLENMQREDLTVLEQAEGFQMMIDLGESVKSISEQTGFSQSTVRHRVKLLELDRDVLEKQGRKIPITDYIKLEQIKDIDRRNDVLKSIGTNNFEWEFKHALMIENRERCKREWLKRLEEMEIIDITDVASKELWRYEGLGWCDYTDSVEKAMNIIPKDAEQIFYIKSDSYFCLYKEKTVIEEEPDDEETLARKKAEQERQEKQSALNNLAELCKESVKDFCHSFKTKSESDLKVIMRLFMFLLINNPYTEYSPDSVIDGDLLEKLEDEKMDLTLSDIPIFNDVPSALLSLAVDSYDGEFSCFDYYNAFQEDKDLIAIYLTIKELGYEASDEELEYINGTHELYVPE